MKYEIKSTGKMKINTDESSETLKKVRKLYEFYPADDKEIIHTRTTPPLSDNYIKTT